MVETRRSKLSSGGQSHYGSGGKQEQTLEQELNEEQLSKGTGPERVPSAPGQGFESMVQEDPERQREIAAKGGRAGTGSGGSAKR